MFWINPYSQRNQRHRWLGQRKDLRALAATQKLGFKYERQQRDEIGRYTFGRQDSLTPYSNDQQNRRPTSPPVRLAGEIAGFTKHRINQAITRGVSPFALHDAVTNPIRILPQSDGSVRYVGHGAVVVLNPSDRS
jgi:hypothetical protein